MNERPPVLSVRPPRVVAAGRRAGVRRVPVAVWVIVAVVVLHGVFFWAVSDKHFMPKTRYVPPPATPNFGAGQTTRVDPRTGEVTTETQFVVSTQLATPTAEPEK